MNKRALGAAAGVIMMAGGVLTPLQAQERMMIVLDGSGSMWGQIDGQPKITIARETLGRVLANVPPQNALGLVVYGHRRKGDCSDIELAVPAAPGAGPDIVRFANRLQPKGKTPLSEAVRQAAQVLRHTEDRATVILVTDGLETCDADPCALGRELEASGVDFTTHVVGFGLNPQEGAQVACLAQETGGQYIEAGNAQALEVALNKTVKTTQPVPQPAPAPKPKAVTFNLQAGAVLAPDGPPIATDDLNWSIFATDAQGAATGEPLQNTYRAQYETRLPAGEYVLRAQLGQVIRSKPISLQTQQTTQVQINMDAGQILVQPRLGEGDDTPDPEAYVELLAQGGEPVSDGGYGQAQYYMPAGLVTVQATRAAVQVSQQVDLRAGQVVHIPLVTGVGTVTGQALFSPQGRAVESGEIYYSVFVAAPDGGPVGEPVNGSYGAGEIALAAGRYVMQARLDMAKSLSAPFEVIAGQALQVQPVLNAGRLRVLAPDAYRISIYELAANADSIDTGADETTGQYGAEFDLALSAGRYLLRATDDNGGLIGESIVQLAPGERQEATIQ